MVFAPPDTRYVLRATRKQKSHSINIHQTTMHGSRGSEFVFHVFAKQMDELGGF